MPQVALGGAVFLLSAASLALEIAAARILAPVAGSSLPIWTAIIAVVVAGFAGGHWIGGRLADRPQSTAAVVLSWAAATTAAIPVTLHALGHAPLGVPGPVTHLVLLCIVLFFVPTAAAGAASPLLTAQAVARHPANAARILGRMYGLGTIGAFIGALAAAFVVIPWLGAMGTALGVASLYAMLGCALFTRHQWRAVIPALIAGCSAIGAGLAVNAFRSPCTTESSYYCIRVVDETQKAGRSTVALFLDLDEHSSNDRDDPLFLYWPYSHFLDEVLTMRGLKGPRVFHLGGGGYGVPRALLARDPAATVDVAELDPAVTQVAFEHMYVAPNARMTIHHGDGRLVLASLAPDARFEAVIGDAYRGLQVPPHLVTREFARLIKGRLAPGGIFVANIIDARVEPRLLFAFLRTLALEFPAVEVWRDVEDIWPSRSTNYVVVAGSEPSRVQWFSSERGPSRTWQIWPGAMTGAAKEGHMILTDDFAPVDRLGGNFCSLQPLALLGLNVTRPGRCP